MYRKFDMTKNLLFAQYFFLTKHSRRDRCIVARWRDMTQTGPMQSSPPCARGHAQCLLRECSACREHCVPHGGPCWTAGGCVPLGSVGEPLVHRITDRMSTKSGVRSSQNTRAMYSFTANLMIVIMHHKYYYNFIYLVRFWKFWLFKKWDVLFWDRGNV
jgi:hypothetical protein